MNKVFEYMMLGLPFVQFDLAQARSESREAALVAPEGTPEARAYAIAEHADDPHRRARIGPWGRVVAARELPRDAAAATLVDAHAYALSQHPPRLRDG